MKKLLYICMAIIFCQTNIYAQKETSWWHFGYKSGLNFNSLNNATASDGTVVPNMPEAIIGPLSTSEGCFTVSTYDGEFLFSSDGTTVYNKAGGVMDGGTGLFGGSSATQSGIAVPKPGSTTEYYIITVPPDQQNKGLCYSTVDMSANGGLGIVTNKNTVIKSGIVDENIAAVPNPNGKDYWLIHRSGQTFYVFAITSSGISSTPHQTVSSSAITSAAGTYVGEIIMSPDYTKLVAGTWYGKQVISAEFYPTSGLMANIKVTTLPSPAYGGSFSSNSKYIYLASGYVSATAYVNTWADMRAGTPFKQLYANITNLRKGLDGRLYGISTPSSGKRTKDLYVILNPDAGGTTVKYFPNYLKNEAYLGLPTFASGFIRIIPKEQPFACAANNRTYSVEVDLSGGNAPAKLEWYFGDGSAKRTQTVSTSQSKYSQVYSYHNAGVYTITITPYKGDGTALNDITIQATVVHCNLKSNPMTRSELLNTRQQMK